jgi:hypothetical protein
LIEIKDDACGAKVVAIVGLKVLICLMITDDCVFYLTAYNICGTSS